MENSFAENNKKARIVGYRWISWCLINKIIINSKTALNKLKQIDKAYGK